MNRYFLAFLVLATSVPSFGLSSFQLPWMNHATPGTVYDTADHKDGVFVIEAYFLNCPYCNQNAPNVDDLADSFANEPRVQVLDVGIDRKDSQYETWITKHHPNHPVLKDDKQQVISQLGTSGYPSTYIVDCKGAVRQKSTGVWNMQTESSMKQTIIELLKQSCSN